MKGIIEYLEARVDGKTLYTKELVYSLEGGALQGVYSDQISFSNLKYSKTGLQLDMFLVSNERIYTSGAKTPLGELQKDFSAVSLFRYELAQRKSTGGITGLFRFVSASGKGIPAEAVVSGIHGVHIQNGTLSLREDQALYRDQLAPGGSYKPVAFKAEHRFFVQDGKLHYEYEGESLDVDAASLRRKPSADSFPPFASIEK